MTANNNPPSPTNRVSTASLPQSNNSNNGGMLLYRSLWKKGSSSVTLLVVGCSVDVLVNCSKMCNANVRSRRKRKETMSLKFTHNCYRSTSSLARARAVLQRKTKEQVIVTMNDEMIRLFPTQTRMRAGRHNDADGP